MAKKYGLAPTYRWRWPTYAEQWDKMQLKQSAARDLASFLRRAQAGKARYEEVQRRTTNEGKHTGVPWWLIAIIAERESGQNWSRSLAQGDRWDRVSRNVPRGRGPFNSWEDAAVDALHLDELDVIPDWTLEKALFALERYNGWGYFYHNVPSCYVWAGTTIQCPGKYTSDGHWNGRAWDTQLGGAAMLRTLMNADSTIQPVRET